MRRAWIGLAGFTLGCAEPIVPAPPTEAAPSIAVSPPMPDGDALLAQARRSIAHGTLASAPRTALLASSSPEHARARALLGVLAPAAEPTPAAAEAPEVELTASTPSVSVTPVTVAPAPSAPVTPAPPRTRPTLERLALKPTKQGAALTIHANTGVLVGVASQPDSGVVRLVLEDVAAAAKVLASRPHIEGARVTDVSAGPKSVRITLRLEPGWRFERVRRTKTGAQVELIAPG